MDDLWIDPQMPAWKANFLRKNAAFYTEHQELIETWLEQWNYLEDFPPSRRKFEWQAQDEPSLADTVIHLRPSGIRAKRATYLPALVAITQTSILGARQRRLSTREASRLQGLPEWFDFGAQPDAATYRQLGNAVNVGAAYHMLREHLLAHQALLNAQAPDLVAAVQGSPESPDSAVEQHWDATRDVPLRTRRPTPLTAMVG